MSDVKRYAPDWNAERIDEAPFGRFVRFEDYEGALEGAVESIAALQRGYDTAHAAMQTERDLARSERDAAVKECERIRDTNFVAQATHADLDAARGVIERMRVENEALKRERDEALAKVDFLSTVIIDGVRKSVPDAISQFVNERNRARKERDAALKERDLAHKEYHQIKQDLVPLRAENSHLRQSEMTLQKLRQEAETAHDAAAKRTDELLTLWKNEFKHGESIPECATRLVKERDAVAAVRDDRIKEVRALRSEMEIMQKDRDHWKERAAEMGRQLNALTTPPAPREEYATKAELARLQDAFDNHTHSRGNE